MVAPEQPLGRRRRRPHDGPTLQVRWTAGAHASAYKVQVSSDNKTWKDVASRTNATGGFEVVPITPTAARYVRLWMTAGVGTSYKVNALEVWGRCVARAPGT